MPRLRWIWCALFAALAVTGVPSPAQAPKPAEVAPGVSLPAGGDATVLVLDQSASGPVLVHVKPHEVVSDAHAATNFLRAQIYSGPHRSFDVEGPHADTVVSSTKAVLFVRISGEDSEIMRARVHLIWLETSKKRREITDFSSNIFGGQRARNMDEVPCDTEMVEGTNWLKVTPKDPLLPGEFAVAFLPKDVTQQPDIVYDFSVPGDKGGSHPYASGTPPAALAKKP